MSVSVGGRGGRGDLMSDVFFLSISMLSVPKILCEEQAPNHMYLDVPLSFSMVTIIAQSAGNNVPTVQCFLRVVRGRW